MSYNPARATALRLVTQKGTTATFRRPVAAIPDDAPWFPVDGAAAQWEAVPIVFVPFQSFRRRTREIDPETGAARGIETAYVPGTVGFEPIPDDEIITLDGQVRRVLDVNKLSPDTTAVLYELTVAL